MSDSLGGACGEEAERIGYIEAPTSGTYKFVIQTNGGKAKVAIKGLNDNVSSNASASDGVSWDYYTTEGLNYSTASVKLTAGNKYQIIVTARQSSAYRDQGVKLGWITPTKAEEDMAAAVEAASKPNTKVVMFTRTGATGHGPVFQTDYDISLDEIKEIKEVQAAAKAAGNEFILVTFGRSGYSFEGDWLDDTDALLCPFYAGQAAGTALAEILTGEVNPSGKLTVTLPKTNNDTLLTYGYYSEDSTSGNNYNKYRAGDQSQKSYTAHYEEGLNFGYRWFDSEEGAEYQYPFGYGLSYTDFEYSNMQVQDNGDFTYTVTVDVTNTGDVTGDDIVQVYIDDGAEVPENVQVAKKQLVAFARVEGIAPGQTKTAEMTVEKRMLSYWDDSIELTERADGTKDKWIVADGTRTLMAGGSSDALTLTKAITIAEEDADLTGIDNALANVPEDLSAYKNADVLEALVEAAEALKAEAGMTEERQGLVNSLVAAMNEVIERLDGTSEDTEAADLGALAEAISKVPTDLGKYESDIAAAVTEKIAAAAEALAAKTDLTADDQGMADALADALETAVEALDSKTAVNSGLDRIMSLISGLDASEYTEESWAKVADALEAAKAVKADPDAAAEDMDAALSDLLAAFGGLEYGIQKLHLETAIQAAESILEKAKDYVADAAALEAAVEAGKTVLADADASQEEVNNAAYAILDELAKLAKKADLTSLESLVEAAKGLLKGNYTEDSLAGLEEAIRQAEAVIATQDRTDSDISDAYADIIDAIISLEMKGNKAALKAMLEKADQILADQSAYVAASVEGLEEVVAEAREVYNDRNAVQEEINDAVETLTLKVADARLKGDVDGDGAVTTGDGAAVLRYAAEMEELDAAAEASADVNEDGVADTEDAVLILQYGAEKIAAF